MKTGRWRHCWAQALVVAAVMFPLAAFAGNGIVTKQYSSKQMIHYSDLKGGGEARDLNDCVFYVDKGETIPMKISLETDFAELKQDQIDIVARQKLYFRVQMDKKAPADQLESLKKLDARALSTMSKAQMTELLKHCMIFLSKDALHWAPLNNGKAAKEVLGIKGGILSLAIVPNVDTGLEASLDVRTTR